MEAGREVEPLHQTFVGVNVHPFSAASASVDCTTYQRDPDPLSLMVWVNRRVEHEEVDATVPRDVHEAHEVLACDARVIQALRRIDLPIEEIREVLGDPEGPGLKTILRRHRDRLYVQQDRVSDAVAQVDRFIEKGLTMSATTNARPVQLKLAVDDVDAAVTFYQQAFGFHYDVTRRTAEAEFSGFVFGNYGDPDFFLVHLHCPNDYDRGGLSNFGLLVEDLDVALSRAVSAGAKQVVPIQDPEGMPQCCAVRDPSGNWIWLYQN